MANYVGAKCPVCENLFSEGDDIVVCPVCGTPHHRACYQKIGKCAFDELHSQGHAWQPPQNDAAPRGQRQDGATRACAACGAANPPDSIFCLSCGARLGETPANGGQSSGFGSQGGSFNAASYAYTAAFGGVSPGEDISGVSARDLALYVGTGSHYFLPRFRALAQGRPFDFNGPALLNFFYCFYRKMYWAGLGLLGLYVLCQIPSLLISSEMVGFFAQHFQEIFVSMDMSILDAFTPQQHPLAVAMLPYMRIVPYFASILLSMFGNRLYLNSAVRNIKKIRALCEQAPGGFDDKIYTEMLARRGRTSFGVVAVVLCGIVLGYLFISFMLMMPYMDMIYNAIGQ